VRVVLENCTSPDRIIPLHDDLAEFFRHRMSCCLVASPLHARGASTRERLHLSQSRHAHIAGKRR
jgi:hypothetical protein